MPGEPDVAQSEAALESEIALASSTDGDAVEAGSQSPPPAEPSPAKDEHPAFGGDLPDPGETPLDPPPADTGLAEFVETAPDHLNPAAEADGDGSPVPPDDLEPRSSNADASPDGQDPTPEPAKVLDNAPAAEAVSADSAKAATQDLNSAGDARAGDAGGDNSVGGSGAQEPSPAGVAASRTETDESPASEPANARDSWPASAITEPEPMTANPIAEAPSQPATPPAEPSAATPPVDGSIPGMPPALPEGAEETEVEPEGLEVPDHDAHLDNHADPGRLRTGEIRRGQVVSVSESGVIVDIGSKTEGSAPLDDFRDEAGELRVSVGDEIDVLVEAFGTGAYTALSHRRAKQLKLWEGLEKAWRNQEPVQAKIVSKVKGGLSADVGLLAFLPGSQVDLRPVPKLDSLIGEDLPVRIVKINKKRGNIVVSRRALLEEARERLKQETLSRLAEGGEVTGTVKNLTDYGAFVDLGGLDGLIHVTDISYGRIKGPSDVLQPGQEVTAKVLKFDPAKERVSLSLKHMQPDPWTDVEERYLAGGKVSGRVTSVSDYGVFVELESGVEGLVHLTELTWSRRRPHPSKVYKAGDEIEAVVLKVKRKERRISLSVKKLRLDPWSTLSDRYQTGNVVEGRVGNLTSYGAFVEVEEGVDGLVHLSDLSWIKRVHHPKEVLKKGERIRAVVLQVDSSKHRIALGLKQLEPDIWETFLSQHAPGDIVTGRVCGRTKFGVFVELVPGVEGLCHQSEMRRASKKKGKGGLEVGRRYRFRIIKLDEFDKKIALSRRDVDDEPNPAHAPATPAPRMEPSAQVLAQPSEVSAEPAAVT